MFADSAEAAAEVAARDRVQVRYEEYEGLPHIFPILEDYVPSAKTSEWWQSKLCMQRWIGAIKSMADGRGIQTGAKMVRTRGHEDSLDVANLTKLTVEEILGKMSTAQKVWKPWTGPTPG